MSISYEKAKLWVYGSLLEGFYNYQKALTAQIEERIPACTKGRLYHQMSKGYPALLPGDDRIYGELLSLRDFETTIRSLDQIEDYKGPGYSNEYNRILTPVRHLEGGITETAYVYWYGRKDIDTPENPSVYIPAGDWRAYMESVRHS